MKFGGNFLFLKIVKCNVQSKNVDCNVYETGIYRIRRLDGLGFKH